MNGDGRLAGKSALVTGGTGRIGGAIVRRLSDEGAAVALGYHRSGPTADRLAAELDGLGRRVVALSADLTVPCGAASLVERTASEFDGLDIVVNCASATYWRPLEQTPLEDIDHILELGARAPYLVMQAASARLRRDGRIVNLSSALAGRSVPGSSLYSAVTAFVEQSTRVASRELAGRRITVNAIAPGAATGGRWAELTDRQQRWLTGRLGTAVSGEPADVAALVAFLVSAEAGFITGQVIHLAGI